MKRKQYIFGILAGLYCCACTLDIPYENQFSDPDAVATVEAARELLANAYTTMPNPEFDLGDVNKKELVEKIRRALYFSKIMSYAQGFEQLRVASENYDWNLNYGDMAKIWREGCIIRAQFLQKITDAYEKNPELKNLMLDDYFKKVM